MVLSFYYCPILERTVFAVGAMVTNVVSKGADKQNVIKFNQRSYHSWSQAREAYLAVSRDAVGACVHFSAQSTWSGACEKADYVLL